MELGSESEEVVEEAVRQAGSVASASRVVKHGTMPLCRSEATSTQLFSAVV